MRETLIKLDDVNRELKEKLSLKDGRGHIDKKWLELFDSLIVDIVKSRVVVEFATKDDSGIDWEFVSKSIEKARR